MKGVSLDLGRMARAMTTITQNWDALHVAGTNGKGSVCTYLSALCTHAQMSNGLFTSPYLVEPRDAIKIDGVPISRQKYDMYRKAVQDDEQKRLAQGSPAVAASTDAKVPSMLTEFELGTMTAFSAFDAAEVETGIVEVGLGGRLDSTNALRKKKVTIITKIGLDHQGLLGDTLPLIAKEKAGIMMAEVPCVVDGSNPPEVLEVFQTHAKEVGAPLHLTTDQSGLLDELRASGIIPHQAQNMACAITAFRLAYPDRSPTLQEAIPLLRGTTHLGRLSWLDVSRSLPSRGGKPILVDGAHNPQSAETLAAYVDEYIRPNASDGQGVLWVVAVSKQDGKDAEGMLRTLTRPEDSVLCVAFNRRPTMPWVEPVDPTSLRDMAQGLGLRSTVYSGGDSESKTYLAACIADVASHRGPIVLTGSLYLVGDAYRVFGDSLSK